MRKPPLQSLLVALLIATLVTIVVRFCVLSPTNDGAPPPGTTHLSAPSSVQEPVAGRERTEADPESSLEVSAGGREERRSVELALSGRVHWSLERSSSAGRVRCFDVDEFESANTDLDNLSNWERLIAEAPQSRVGVDGEFVLELGPGADRNSPRWVVASHPEHAPISARSSALGAVPELIAKAVRPVPVVLRHGDQTEDGPARIYALFEPAAKGSFDAHLPAVFETGTEGDLKIPAAGGLTLVWAVAGETRSSLWRGHLEEVDRLVLELGRTFSAHGTIHAEDPDRAQFESWTVSAHRMAASGRELLGATTVDPDRTWELPSLATGTETAVVFRLEGEQILAQERAIAVPTAGSDARVDFTLGAPTALVVHVLGESDENLGSVQVRGHWESAAMDGQSTRSKTAITEESGQAVVMVPAGDVRVELEKKGYVPALYGPARVPLDGAQKLDLRLHRAGHLVGTCTQAGAPVMDFTLTYWTGNPEGRIWRDFRGREDGGFVVDDCPLGLLQVLASTPTSPGAELATVEVFPGGSAWLEIELPLPGTATGYVVDAATGLPLSEAEVQVHQSVGGQRLGPWGEPYRTNALGEFEGIPIGSPVSLLEIRAPGFASEECHALPSLQSPHDCGRIELAPSQDLLVRLVGAADASFDGYTVDVQPADERQTFDSAGEAHIEGVAPGQMWITVTPPGGASRVTARTTLEIGDDWTVEVSLGDERSLVVNVEPAPGEPLSEGMWIGANFQTPSGPGVQHYQELPALGSVEFEGVVGSQVVIDVLEPVNWTQRAFQLHQLEESGVTVVGVRLTNQEYRLRFVLPDGSPLSSTSVFVNPEESLLDAVVQHVTDESGDIRLQGFEPGPIVVGAILPNAMANGIPVELPTSADEVIQVVIDAEAGLRLRLLDGDEPIPGLWARLRRGRVGPIVASSRSDDTGLVDFGHLTPRSYRAEVWLPTVWPASMDVEATAEFHELSMQVRRLGTLSVQAESAGQPAAHARLELVSVEFSESVDSWLAAARIESSSGSMDLDASGTLVLNGLPRGDYRWKLRSTTGREQAGSTTVEAGQPALLFVRLGE